MGQASSLAGGDPPRCSACVFESTALVFVSLLLRGLHGGRTILQSLRVSRVHVRHINVNMRRHRRPDALDTIAEHDDRVIQPHLGMPETSIGGIGKATK